MFVSFSGGNAVLYEPSLGTTTEVATKNIPLSILEQLPIPSSHALKNTSIPSDP